MIWVFVYILLLHWIGDFVLQTQWVADNKSKNVDALILHVFTYCLILFCGLIITSQWVVIDLCRFVTITFATHLVTDLITIRMTKLALTEKKNMHLFFATIGMDQFIHTSLLLVTAEFLKS